MSSHLHVDTAALRPVRLAVEALCASLRPAAPDPADLAALDAAPGGAALVAEHDRLLAAVSATRRELADLAVALAEALAALDTAERRAVGALAGGAR